MPARTPRQKSRVFSEPEQMKGLPFGWKRAMLCEYGLK